MNELPQPSILHLPPKGYIGYRVRLKLIREGRTRYIPTKLTSSRTAYHFVSTLQDSDRERFINVFLDNRNQVMGAEEVAVGTANKAVIMPPEVFKAALLCNAAALIIAHNHPSGDPRPSPEDVHLTNELRRCAKFLGVRILDHIVVGEASYYSFADDQWPLVAHEVGIRGQARISGLPEGMGIDHAERRDPHPAERRISDV